jgi:hypothetical protein
MLLWVKCSCYRHLYVCQLSAYWVIVEWFTRCSLCSISTMKISDLQTQNMPWLSEHVSHCCMVSNPLF